jgi:hypothetical protein
MFDKPIITIEQAEEYFRAFHCSGFRMDFHGPKERTNEYKKLNITEKIEGEWINKQFDEFYFSIMEQKLDKDLFWQYHWKMYDLYANLNAYLKREPMLRKMLEVTRRLRDLAPTLDILDKVVIAETINGGTGKKIQSARIGLIYKAYDAGDIEAAKEFADLSLHFSSYGKEKFKGKQRCIDANKLCINIKRELGFR